MPSSAPDPEPLAPPPPPPAVLRSEALETELAVLEGLLRPNAPDPAPERKDDGTEPPPGSAEAAS